MLLYTSARHPGIDELFSTPNHIDTCSYSRNKAPKSVGAWSVSRNGMQTANSRTLASTQQAFASGAEVEIWYTPTSPFGGILKWHATGANKPVTKVVQFTNGDWVPSSDDAWPCRKALPHSLSLCVGAAHVDAAHPVLWHLK